MSDLVGNPEDRFSHNEAHIVKLGFTGVYFLFLLRNIDCEYTLEPPLTEAVLTCTDNQSFEEK